MRIRALIVLLAVFPAVVGAQGKAPLFASDDPAVRVEGRTLHYVGLLNKRGLERLRPLLERHPDLREIRISSSGGEAFPGMEIGQLVRARALDVVVDQRCNSACANFIFLPAPKKTILPNAIVFWHNSCPQNVDRDVDFSRVVNGDVDNLAGEIYLHGRKLEGEEKAVFVKRKARQIRKKMNGYFAEYAERHRAFYAGEPYDSRIVCIGDYVQLPQGPGYAYTFSVKDMARLGVCGVHAEPGYEEHALEVLAASNQSPSAGTLRLSDYPEFKPSYRGPPCDITEGGDLKVSPRTHPNGVD
jgi:hypothetical protein